MKRVSGAIDGKHIAMDCPKGPGSFYHNYKGFFSLVLLAACDAKYVFTAVDVVQYGHNNDAGGLANSELGKKMELGGEEMKIPKPEPVDGFSWDLLYYFVGDEIFPLKSCMMRAYPGKLDEKQRIFNYRLSRVRRVIENAFGILVARWRIFWGPIRATPENVLRYLMAAICLHNYLQQTENASYCPLGFVDSYDNNGTIKPGQLRHIVQYGGSGLTEVQNVCGCRYSNNAIEMREALKEYLNSEAGSVDWQLERVRMSGRKP